MLSYYVYGLLINELYYLEHRTILSANIELHTLFAHR